MTKPMSRIEVGARRPRTAVRWGRLALGCALVLIGLAVLTTLFVIVYGETPPLMRAGEDLGLPLTLFLSGLAQVAELIGLWLVWSAIPFRRDQRH